MNEALRIIKTVAKREFAGYFASPVAYVFIVIFLLMTGFFTFLLGGFFERGEASLSAPFFMWHPWIYLIFGPVIGMRLWAEERRQGTLELLLTLPITPWQAILGKFFASWLFLIISLALTFPVVITVCWLGHADLMLIVSGYLGSAFLSGVFLAVTEMTSALTRNQVISFIISVVICFFLIFMGWEPVTVMLTRWAPESLVSLVGGFSVMPHFDAFRKGDIGFRHVVYFVSAIVYPLFCTGVIIRSARSN